MTSSNGPFTESKTRRFSFISYTVSPPHAGFGLTGPRGTLEEISDVSRIRLAVAPERSVRRSRIDPGNHERTAQRTGPRARYATVIIQIVAAALQRRGLRSGTNDTHCPDALARGGGVQFSEIYWRV